MDFERLANAIGSYVMKHFVEPRLARTVGFYRAQVVGAASNGKITVQRPFDQTPVALPYTKAAESLTVGSQCIVLMLGNASNAIVFSDGMMFDIGSGGGGGGNFNVEIDGTDLEFTAVGNDSVDINGTDLTFTIN